MYHMYQLDAFTQSCPADQDIINHYKLQQVSVIAPYQNSNIFLALLSWKHFCLMMQFRVEYYFHFSGGKHPHNVSHISLGTFSSPSTSYPLTPHHLKDIFCLD